MWTKAAPTILIADDQEDTRQLLKDLLTPYGFKFLEAGTGLEVLQILQETRPSMIILDLLMPGMDGLRAAEEIASCLHTRQVPILVLSALTDPATRARAGRLGIERFIGKPFALIEVLDAVHSILKDRSRMN